MASRKLNQREGRSRRRGAADKPVKAPAPSPHVPPQRFLVRIENLTSNMLEVSVLDESGKVEGLSLAPRSISRPIDSRRVGARTHDLVTRGHVRLRPIN